MVSQMESPALAARGTPKSDLLTGWINSEDSTSIRSLQVSALMRRYAITDVMAVTVASLLFGEVRE